MVEISQQSLVVTPKHLTNLGICEVQLPRNIIDDFWKLIDEAKQNPKDIRNQLAGNISSSLALDLESPHLNEFGRYILPPLIETYNKHFDLPWRVFFDKEKQRWNLDELWVNFQKQTEFNPMHDHAGVFSFVIWMKIPTDYEQQVQLPIARRSNAKGYISNFSFVYTDIIGQNKNYTFEMRKNIEGYLVFFPARLHHQVSPFFECDEERVTISGNITIV
tara:strand:+ start:96 stop:752 length:657 start_codon:yes stop_codon:yes gene_type:complete